MYTNLLFFGYVKLFHKKTVLKSWSEVLVLILLSIFNNDNNNNNNNNNNNELLTKSKKIQRN